MDMDAWDENDLVHRLKMGQDQAYAVLINQYQSRLFNVIYGITMDREESYDILQDVFLKVFKNINQFEQKSSLYSWLRRISINESLNWRRKVKRRFRFSHTAIETMDLDQDPNLGNEDYGPENLYNKKELENAIKKELNYLPVEARTAFLLKEMEGLSYDEIAKILKVKKGTVSSRIFYARQRLKKAIAKLEE